MNEKAKHEHGKEDEYEHDDTDVTQQNAPPLPLLQPASSGDDVVFLKQQMAFHHPPPSFEDPQVHDPHAIFSITPKITTAIDSMS